jgi:ABC-type bacteriocin/lantibiotic exporter with double-glycine peptidase domain
MAGHHSRVPWHGPAPWLRLKDWLVLERQNLWVAVVYSIAIGLLSLALPLATQSLVNTVAFGSVLQPLFALTIILLVFLAFSSVLQVLRTWVVENLQRRIFVQVASDSLHRMLNARLSAFDGTHPPEMVNRFLEVVNVQKGASILLVDGLTIIMQTVIGMALLAVYHPFLGILDFFLVVGIGAVIWPLGAGSVKTAVLESKARYGLVAWLQEVGRHWLAFKSRAGSLYAAERANQLVEDYLQYRNKHFRVLLRQIIGSLTLQTVASAALLGVGGWLVIGRELTLGQLIASELVLTLVVSGFAKFGKQLETYYDLCAAVDKLGYLTDLDTETSGPDTMASGPPAMVELKNLTFAYPGKAATIREVTLRVAPGARVGVAARSGEGKSTLIDLIWRLRTPQSGVVEIDGNDIRNYDLTSLREQVAVVRVNEIFHGTVAENVGLAQPHLKTGDLREALQAVGLLEEISALPAGMETPLSTFGLPLSQSQALRLALARAIVSRPRVLIVDEVLDQIDDPATRRVLLHTLFDPRAPWTLLVFTENDSVLALCDQVFVLRNGYLEPSSPLAALALPESNNRPLEPRSGD